MKQFFLQFFTWWNGQTLGTRLFTWRTGEKIGTDEFGNVYYRTRGGRIDPALGHERRWVVYNGLSEASSVPAGWNGWLRHTVDLAPSQEDYVAREWQQPHKANMTGTPQAYRPKGSAVTASAHPKAANGAYKPWTPGD
jgi:NADH:ubiquinone oxidoreductase subunit